VDLLRLQVSPFLQAEPFKLETYYQASHFGIKHPVLFKATEQLLAPQVLQLAALL
jgi:hypothetical protein